jgi:ABC-type sugar transport system permease subunit
MIAPALAFTLVFALYPVLESFALSLQRVFLAVP